jgi:hypothetical protein
VRRRVSLGWISFFSTSIPIASAASSKSGSASASPNRPSSTNGTLSALTTCALPVVSAPYRIRPRSPLLFCDWKEQYRRFCKLSILTVINRTLTCPSSGATHSSLAILRRSSRSSSALLHHHLSTRDTRFSLYCSLHALRFNTSVSCIKYISSLLLHTLSTFLTMLPSAFHVLQYRGVAGSSRSLPRRVG